MRLELSATDLKILDDKFTQMLKDYKSEHFRWKRDHLVKDPDRKPRMAYLEEAIKILEAALVRTERRWLLYAKWLAEAVEIKSSEINIE